jgi:hypothetical protein
MPVRVRVLSFVLVAGLTAPPTAEASPWAMRRQSIAPGPADPSSAPGEPAEVVAVPAVPAPTTAAATPTKAVAPGGSAPASSSTPKAGPVADPRPELAPRYTVEPDNGSDLALGAVLLLVVGGGMIGGGLAIIGTMERDDGSVADKGSLVASVALLTLGLAPTIGGFVALAKALDRRRTWKEWHRNRSRHVVPTLGRTRHGTWTAGLVVEF